MAKTKHRNTTIENRKAYHDYFVEETLECGISLRGNEVKSIRAGKASIKEAWIAIEKGQLLLKKMHITSGILLIFLMLTKIEKEHFSHINLKSETLKEKLRYKVIL